MTSKELHLEASGTISPWLEGYEPAVTSLSEDIDVDVAIIGGGYAGLCSALELRAEGLSVAVLEAEVAGFGASGRNAGHLTPTIGKDVPTLLRLFDDERSRALLRLANTAVEYVEGLIETHAIGCHYEAVGNVLAAVHPRQHKFVDRCADACERLESPGQLLDRDALRDRGVPAAFTRGFLEPHGGLLQPGLYLRGLREAAVASGVRLFERSAVGRVERGEPAVVHTAEGRVTAGHVVVATNAFSGQLGFLRGRIAPLFVQLFRTEPLGQGQLEAIGWRGREGIYTAHEILESWRLTHDNRIVGGSKYVLPSFGSRTRLHANQTASRRIERVFRERFPELSDVALTDHWGGPIACALDFLPVIGPDKKSPNVIYAAGFAGHGVAQASYAGRCVADLIAGRPTLAAPLFEGRRIPMPPEPLRWSVGKALTAMFRFIDAGVDRAARRSRQ